jgi:hypothetical protein
VIACFDKYEPSIRQWGYLSPEEEESRRYVFEPELAVIEEHLLGLGEVLDTFPASLDDALKIPAQD